MIFIIIISSVFFLLSWILAVIEMIGTHYFSSFWFKTGLKINNTSINTAINQIPEKKEIERENGKFHFLKNNKVLFRKRRGTDSTKTAINLKSIGLIDPKNGIVHIQSRIALGPLLCITFWSIGWFSSLWIFIIDKNSFMDYYFLAIGSIPIFYTAFIGYPYEKRKHTQLKSELLSILEKSSQHSV